MSMADDIRREMSEAAEKAQQANRTYAEQMATDGGRRQGRAVREQIDGQRSNGGAYCPPFQSLPCNGREGTPRRRRRG